MSSIPEDNHEEGPSEPTPKTRRMEIDPLNEVAPVDNTPESDDSALVIINKNEVPVCSTDFPPAKHENKKDWFKRRKQIVPIASTSTVEKSEDLARGRKLPRITIPINPDPSGIHEEEPITSPKRRFLSLSPIKTIFPSKAAHLDRPLSAISSPSSPRFSLGNKNFFRSTNSLTPSSLLRVPGPQKKDSISRRLFSHKGKERAKEPIFSESLQDNWEVVEQTADGEQVEVEEHPQSLMSVVIDSFSANGSTTTSLKDSPTKTKSRSVTPSDEAHLAAPTSPLTDGNSDTTSPQIASQSRSFEDQNSPDQLDQKMTDTPQTSLSSTPLARTPTSSPPQTSPAETVILQEQLLPSAASHSFPTPLPPSRPNVIIDPQATEGDIAKYNLEPPFPMTPVYLTNSERGTSPGIDEFKEKLPPPLVPVAVWCSPAASRSIPDLLTNSDHTLRSPHTGSACSCGTRQNVNPSFKSIPSPLGMHTYPSYQTSIPPNLSLLSAEEPLTTTRPHYAGRPLPCPPPIPDVQRRIINSVLTVNTGPAAGMSNGSSDRACKEGKGKEGEGLLIDLEDTSLDTNPLSSPTTTIRSGSDESRYHSQVYLPLMPSPSSSAIFTREPLPTELFFSPSSISTNTVIIPRPNHLTCPQHRYQYQQHNHRFPYSLSQPQAFSKSNLDLPSRYHDGMHDSLQSDVHRLQDLIRDTGGGTLNHYCSCEHSVMPRVTHQPPSSMPVTHGVYPSHYHHLTMDNTQRQRHHLAHLSY